MAEMRSDGPLREGSRFVNVYRGLENDLAPVELDRPKPLVVAGTNGRMAIDTAHVLSAEDGGARVVVSTEVRPKGLIGR